MKQRNNPNRQRLREGTYANLYSAIFKWLLVVSGRDVAVSELVLKTKAKEFAVSFKAVSREGNTCTSEMTAPWEETTFPTILSKYELEEI